MDGTTELALAIGGRVRRLRQGRGWTLDHLATTTGVSRRMLVHVEQGATNPSVGTLLKISSALGVGLPTLVEPPQPRPVTLVRAGEGACLWTGEHGGHGLLVAGSAAPDVVELWDWTLGPGDAHASEGHAAGTRELLQVQEGAVTVEVAGEQFVLQPGDGLAFPGDAPHAYRAAGAAARFSLVVSEPGAGALATAGAVGA